MDAGEQVPLRPGIGEYQRLDQDTREGSPAAERLALPRTSGLPKKGGL
jgi:hypothetical protein